MKKPFKKEKRLHPRLSHNLACKVAANGYDFTTTTQNISCLGAYCCINKYVPPFTRVMVKLDLPAAEAGAGRGSQLECKGVIVRSEDDPGGGFNIAIFFNAIKEGQRKKISRYISRFLPSESPTLIS